MIAPSPFQSSMIRIHPRLRSNFGLFLLLSSGNYSACSFVTRGIIVGRRSSSFWTSSSSSSISANTNAPAIGEAYSSSLFSRGGGINKSNMMSTTISFNDDGDSNGDVTTTMIVGKKKVLEDLASSSSDKFSSINLDEETATAVLNAIDGPSGSASTFVKKHKVVFGTIPEKVSRNNHPWSVHSITDLVADNIPKGQTTRLIFVGHDALEHHGALVSAVAKAFPVYSRKTISLKKAEDGGDSDDDASSKKHRSIQITFWDETGSILVPSQDASTTALAAVEGIQLCARLVDMPPEELTTDAYAAECHQLAESLDGVTATEIIGGELDQKGYGGIFSVGKAATCPPRLLIMEFTPPPSAAATEEEGEDATTIALVGKSIVYDTGGLSLKPKTGMCGMKVDMGGSAGLLGGFVAAVKAGYPHKLVLLMCMAENAIGPTAFRNDDILTLYSG